MKRDTQIIRHPSQLMGLKVWNALQVRSFGQIKIEAEQVPKEEILVWEKSLNRLYFACGCDKAAVGLLLGVVACVIWFSMRPGGLTIPGWSGLWIGVVVVIFTTGIGKMIGLWIAQRRLTRLIKQIESDWKALPLPEPEFVSCG